jgi:regulatory protein SWI6
LADIQGMLNGLNADFAAEIKSKQDALDLTQAHLRAATRSLAEQRKQINVWQAECAELDLVAQRSRNLEKALEEEDGFDWTGRTEIGGTDAAVLVGSAFKHRELRPELGAAKLPSTQSEDTTLPVTDSAASLIRLRRIRMWQLRMDNLMRERVVRLGSASAEKEFQCKKIVSLCTGVPMDKVEEVCPKP